MLKGHKKVGTKFIPPMRQFGGMQQVGYVDEMLPELLWLGLLHDQYGYSVGSRVVESLVNSASLVVSDEKDERNFVLASAIDSLDAEQRVELLKQLKETPAYEMIQVTIAPLVRLYENCPMSFFEPRRFPSKDEQKRVIRNCVEKHFDKHDTPGTVLQGAIFLSLLVQGKIYFSEGMKLPDFDKAISKPESTEGKTAAASIRAMSIGLFGQSETGREWARSFWRQNLDLFQCEIENDD